MKRKTLFLISIAILMLASCSKKPMTSYVINGNIQGLPEGVHVQLVPVSHNNEKPIADTVAPNGQFTFTGVANEPLLVRLTIEGSYGGVVFMLENAEIDINGTVTESESNGATSYNFDSVVVEGSQLTDVYKQKISVRDTLDKLYIANREKHKEIFALLNQARQSKDQAKLDSLMKTDAYKALNADESAFFKAVNDIYSKLYLDNKDSFWGPLMMLSTMSYFTEEQKAVYEQFSQQAKDSYYGKLVKDELYPPSFIGKPVPEFTVNSKDGEQSLTKLRNGKKYILVDFWASWCGPCRKEIPNLKKLYSQYSGKGLEIVSISTDKKVEDWQKALTEEKLPWPNFRDESGIADQYMVKFIPAIFLLDANGVLLAENIRGEELANKLNELFTK